MTAEPNAGAARTEPLPDPNARLPPRPYEAIQPGHLYKAIGLLLLVLIVHSHFSAISQVLLLVFAAAILAVAFNTIVTLIPNHRRWFTALLGLVIFGGIAASLWFAVPALAEQLRGLSGELPRYRAELDRWATEIGSRIGLDIDPFGSGLQESIGGAVSGERVLGSARGLLEGLFFPLVLLMGALFATAQPNDRLLTPLLRIVPAARRPLYLRLLELLGMRLRAWVKGTLLSMLIIGVMVTLGLWLLGVPYALLLGVIAGLSEIVPLVGPWVSGVIAVGVAYMNEPSSGLYVAGLMLAVQQVESNLITPLVMAKVADVHPFVTLFSFFLFTTLFGFLGILLTVPLVLLVWTVVQVLWVEGTLATDHDWIEPVVEVTG